MIKYKTKIVISYFLKKEALEGVEAGITRTCKIKKVSSTSFFLLVLTLLLHRGKISRPYLVPVLNY